jgi:hypothetical protein
VIRRQELMAVAHCSSRRFLPERYRDLGADEVRSLG